MEGSFFFVGYHLGWVLLLLLGGEVMLLELSTDRMGSFAEQGEVEMLLPECQGCAVVLYGGLVASWHQAVPAPRLEGASSWCRPSVGYGLASGSPVEGRAGGGGVGAA